ncbi:MAG: sulfotransferase family 2 domain-containing protein [Pseudomonadota bacterium]
MILNHSHQFLFIHVPKTAGTTVSTYLTRYAGPADIDLAGAVPEDTWASDTPNSFASELNAIWHTTWDMEKHARVMRIRKRLGHTLWQRYFKFAFVRNPFARTFSGFRFLKRNNRLGPAFEQMTFSEFLASDWFQTLSVLPIQSQAAFLAPIAQVDFVGRQETLAEDLAFVASIIERRRIAPVALPVLNQSADPDGWRTMSEADRDIIRRVLAQDFETLGYCPETGAPVSADGP